MSKATEITIDGVSATVKCGNWLPKLLRVYGITIGSTIRLACPAAKVWPGLLAHEFGHVLQWREKGFWKFGTRYVRDLIHDGYGAQHPAESDAMAYALANTDRFLVPTQTITGG